MNKKAEIIDEPATETFTVTITAIKDPLYNLPSDSQMYFTPNGRLFVSYDDDHDEDPNQLHDVSDLYDVKVVKS